MSKVVHLSDQAHIKAKAFCKANGLRMSDWVAMLIEEAVAVEQTEPQTRVVVSKKKAAKPASEPIPVSEEAPAYSAPPFWEMRQSIS